MITGSRLKKSRLIPCFGVCLYEGRAAQEERKVGLMRYDFKTILLTTALCVAGCSNVSIPEAKPTTGRLPTVAEVPDAEETVRGAEDPPIVTLELGSRLRERRASLTEELPGSIIVPTTNLNAVPVTTALQAVLTGTDVSLSWDSGSFDDRLVSVTNLSGALPRVVEKICSSAKIFCNYRHGLLELKERETFIIELPAIPAKGGASAANSMADTIGDMAKDKVRVDQQGGNLIYTTDVEGEERVRQYLAQLRNGRPLVVMQLYIWEVTLDRDNGTGINWSDFKVPELGGNFEKLVLTGSSGFASLASPGVTMNANFSGKVNAATVLKFLSTQGQVQTVSSPQMTFVSGQNALFRVGGKQRYISQVGQLTTGSVTGSNASNTGVGNNTVSTDTIDTGLTVDVSGSYENGVISAQLEITTQDLVSLNPTVSSGVTIDLPETSERKVSTMIRVRPGDNLVMAGLVSSRDDNSHEGVPLPFGGRLPMVDTSKLKNTELVILVKPSVVLFSDTATVAEEKKRAAGEGKTPLDAVMIDKDGAKTLSLPSSQPLSLQKTATPQPELMVSQPAATSLRDVPIASSDDGAPVDRHLMQRGFSHAFDELLSPVSDEATRMDAQRRGGAP